MRVLHGVSDIEKSWRSSSAYSTCEQELTLFHKCDFLEILLRRRVLEVIRAWRAEDCSFQKNAILKTPNSANFFSSPAAKLFFHSQMCKYLLYTRYQQFAHKRAKTFGIDAHKRAKTFGRHVHKRAKTFGIHVQIGTTHMAKNNSKKKPEKKLG